MPYHVFAKDGSWYPPSDCDLETEEEVLRNYCIPYLEGKPITIGGTKLTEIIVYHIPRKDSGY